MADDTRKKDLDFDEAYQQATEKVEVTEEEKTETAEVKEDSVAKAVDKLNEAPQADIEGVEKWSDEETKADYDKRIKGYQAQYTKSIQNAKIKMQQELGQYKAKLQDQFTKAIGALGGAKPAEPAPKEDDLFKDADPKQVELFNKAVEKVVAAKLEPLTHENEQLKSFMTQSQQLQVMQSQYQQAVQQFPALGESGSLTDLTNWVEAHADQVAGRGFSIGEIYMLKTYDEQRELGKKEALAELQKKEKEQLDVSTAGNTVEDSTGELDFADAFKAAQKEIAAKHSK